MTKFTNPEPLDWLFGLELFGIKLGLDNINAIVDALGHPERTFPSVHIAGTNGKGSVTAMVDAALGAAGYRSGRYTSPHLLDLAERFVIGGRRVDREVLVGAVASLRDVVEELRERGAVEVHPTFFEATTAVAFELFHRAGVEVGVFEVGLGGRLDATNVLTPVVTAITSIGLDHEQYLGGTLAEVAAEKAGIIKSGVPVVLGRMDPAAVDAIKAVASERGAPVIEASRHIQFLELEPVAASRAETGLTLHAAATRVLRARSVRSDYGRVVLGLRGAHQIENAAVAVAVIEVLADRGLRVPPPATVEGLARVSWPGRLDLRRLPDGREALLDAAHNPDGAAALACFLRASEFANCPLVFGAMRDKDVDGMLRALAPAVGSLVVTRASNARAADPALIGARAEAIRPELATTIAPSPAEAIEAAWRISPRIVVAGSILLLGDVMNAAGWS